jgi:hypothetical protein
MGIIDKFSQNIAYYVNKELVEQAKLEFKNLDIFKDELIKKQQQEIEHVKARNKHLHNQNNLMRKTISDCYDICPANKISEEMRMDMGL